MPSLSAVPTFRNAVSEGSSLLTGPPRAPDLVAGGQLGAGLGLSGCAVAAHCSYQLS
jgi:hypothetical protein